MGFAQYVAACLAFNWEIIPARGVPYVTFTGPATNAWYNTNQTVDWIINDYEPAGGTPGTGIAGLTQGWDSIPADPSSEAKPGSGNSFYSGPQFPGSSKGCLSLAAGDCGSGSGQGCHTVYVRGWNNQGWNTSFAAAQSGYPETYGPLCYDTVAPTITASNAPAANSNGWNNSTVTVTLNASDPGGSNASGIYKTYYAVNTGTCYPTNLGGCSVYSGPFSITGQGYNYVYFFTEDKAGNLSASAGSVYEWVYIDETAPVTTASLSGTLNGSVYNSAVSVTLNPTDNLSGVQYAYYSLDGGASATYSAAFNVTALGSHSVKFHSVDYAGNVESTKTVNFTISQASQTITFNNPGTQVYGVPLTLTATASSGLAVTYTTSTPTICTISGSVASFIATGTCGVYANQAGSMYVAAAPQVGHAWVVSKAPQTITFTNPGTQTYGVPLTLTATASSGLTVAYTSTNTAVCTISGSNATMVATGTCGVDANQAGNVRLLGSASGRACLDCNGALTRRKFVAQGNLGHKFRLGAPSGTALFLPTGRYDEVSIHVTGQNGQRSGKWGSPLKLEHKAGRALQTILTRQGPASTAIVGWTKWAVRPKMKGVTIAAAAPARMEGIDRGIYQSR